MKFPERLRASAQHIELKLREAKGGANSWIGELASSALATATAIAALGQVERSTRSSEFQPLIDRGLAWLAAKANPDGGWGDTVRSRSNLSTTLLVWAASNVVSNALSSEVAAKAESWLNKEIGGLSPECLQAALLARYGSDRTFSVPILTMCALTGRLGPEGWQKVPALPFELAACPPSWFAALRLPVVSYALPALIAIGQVRHALLPSRFFFVRQLRDAMRNPTLRVLEKIQPSSGGFLEATPLTSFVLMSLAGAGHADHPVAKKAVEFLASSIRQDGSWPVDTDLATWVTTLSINALAAGEAYPGNPEEIESLRRGLLRQQFKTLHPYTNAAPGGWAWTPLPGGVPDADDTAGAVLALLALGTEPRDASVQGGIHWLLQLQNRDGGMPTFCRGWGKLPFDRSSPDLTAHALRSWSAVEARYPEPERSRLRKAAFRALQFLHNSRGEKGWAALWFGNEHSPDETNLTYGTSRVALCLCTELARSWPGQDSLLHHAVRDLVQSQTREGGWNGGLAGPPSLEESALALEALAQISRTDPSLAKALQEPLRRGLEWMLDRLEEPICPTPIGFYFARLWYFEQLYPLIFATAALKKAVKIFP